MDETGLLKGIAGAAQIWRALEACGIPDVLGVWNHEAGPAIALPRFKSVSAIPAMPARRCTSPAPAKVAPMPASGRLSSMMTSMPATSRWAMCTRFDPKVDIDLVQKAWASKRDPLYLPGNFNNRILIDACIPYDMKLKGTFPQVVDVSTDLRGKLRAKFPALFNSGAYS